MNIIRIRSAFLTVMVMTLGVSWQAVSAATVDIAEDFNEVTFTGELTVTNNSLIGQVLAFSVYNDTVFSVDGDTGTASGNWHAGIFNPSDWDTAVATIATVFPSASQGDFETVFDETEGLAMVYWVESLTSGAGLDIASFISPKPGTEFNPGDATAAPIDPFTTAGGFTFVAETGGSPFAALLTDGTLVTGTTNAIPLPAAVWLFGSGLLGLIGLSRRKKSA